MCFTDACCFLNGRIAALLLFGNDFFTLNSLGNFVNEYRNMKDENEKIL